MMKRDAGERPSWVAMMLEASADTINECSVPNIRAHRSLKFGRAAGQAFGREDPLQEPSRPLYNVHELAMERRVGRLTNLFSGLLEFGALLDRPKALAA